MADLKPLPALPNSLLSVEAQNHRASLIKHFLSDIHEHGIESRRGGWLYVFEEVLDDVSQQIIRGDWLASIKRTKEAHKNYNRPRDTGDQTKEKPLPAKPEPPLQQLRKLAARPAPPKGEQRHGHLVLCVAPHGSRLPLPKEDNSFDVVPANIGCVFSPGAFTLQDQEQEEVYGTVLFGLSDELGVDERLRLVGGTFTFKGIASPMQYHSLRKAFRLAVYVHFSLLLEQTVLSNSGVRLNFARPKLPVPSPSTPAHTSDDTTPKKESTNEATKRKSQRSSIVPSSFTDFFLKRNFSYRRSNTINPTAGRNGGSLDLNVLHPSSSEDATTPRRSIEGAVSGLRLRRLSFLGDHRLSLRKSTSNALEVKTEPTMYNPFSLAIKRIEESKTYLSTSAGVVLPVPKLILELAEKEKRHDAEGGPLKRRLKGDERVALTSLLGWDGKDAEGRGMSGILGFVRHQEISVLCSAHVPAGLSIKPQNSTPNSTLPNTPPSVATHTSTSLSISTQIKDDPAPDPSGSTIALTTSSQMTSSTTANLPQSGLSPCGKPHWITYQYYSTQNGNDFTLGEWLHDIAMRRTIPCEMPGCKFTQGQHERRLIHDGVRLIVRISEARETMDKGKERQTEGDDVVDSGDKFKDEDVAVWESCAVCDAKTPWTQMSDGTFLSSFAKYLELLIYSPSICVLTPTLCEHTNPPPGPWSTLPWSRFNIIRHFSTHSTDISIALSSIDDIFELRVPKLQITREVDKSTPGLSLSPNEHEGLQKKALRKEIKKWWERISDHLDKIEQILSDVEQSQKVLPRLPSMDSAYNVFDTPESETPPTPRAHDYNSVAFPAMPPSTPNSPPDGLDPSQQDSYFTTNSVTSTNTEASRATAVSPKRSDDPMKLLAALRHNFQKIEQSLYTQLARTPEGSLNDVRRSFLATAQGTKNRIRAWQKKHLNTANANLVGDLVVTDEPSWWDKKCHAVPSGNIIVREDDWGSIIAHTLSTTDYQLELANLTMVRTGSMSQPHPSPTSESGTSSFFSVASGYKLFSTSSKNQPDPDQENVVWNEPEAYSSAISRKQNAKDSTSLLAIRDVLRQKSVPEQSNGPPSTTSSRLSSFSNSNVPSVKSKPDIGLTIQAAGGKINASDTGEHTSEALLQGLGQAIPSRPASAKSGIIPNASLEDVPTHVKEESATSMTSAESGDSENTVGKNGVPAGNDHSTTNVSEQPSQLPPPLPPKEDPKTPSPGHIGLPSTSTAPSAWPSSSEHEATPSQSSGFASTLASGLSSAMRFVMKSEPISREPTPSGTANTNIHTNTRNQHHVLLADIANFDERPHIKYDWTIGKRMKFSCTVYYAKQFDMLRKRCGIHSVFLTSLSKSTNWMAEGGKSKSNFWKTSDDRFIIKTLVNAWNVADLQVLVDFAPSYFRYMEATASKPTVLCKVLGFYTIEIKNLETGATQSKVDLLVMENLFFKQNINKTFDLKGIQGRKVKTHGDTTKTFFDGEWIEGQQRTLTLVRPHSKVILRDAIKNDAEFLAKSNIMDYSLLLGVDEQKKEIACGLVDTIGSYTFAKTIEYKAKQGLQSGKEVTVMPPTEYQERFVNALEGYFVACPDKWSKPLNESKIVNDPDLLPSVL